VPQLFFLLAAAANQQKKPPEFVPASLWHRAMQLPRRYTAIRRRHNKSNCAARATCRETSSLCQQSQPELSQHQIPAYREASQQSVQGKKHAQVKVAVAISHKK